MQHHNSFSWQHPSHLFFKRNASPLISAAKSYVNPRWVYGAWLWQSLLPPVGGSHFWKKVGPRGPLVSHWSYKVLVLVGACIKVGCICVVGWFSFTSHVMCTPNSSILHFKALFMCCWWMIAGHGGGKWTFKGTKASRREGGGTGVFHPTTRAFAGKKSHVTDTIKYGATVQRSRGE